MGARGGGVTLIGQALRMLIQLVGVVVLSRLLSPSDFGLIAMVAVFMTLADLLRDFGLPSAALQAKDLSHQQASNMFWASTSLGALSCLVLTSVTPLIVALYGESRLAPIIPALALTLLVSGAQAQIQIQLARAAKFTALALIATVAPAAGLAVAVAAAVSGLEYWALVLQALTTPVVLFLGQVLVARWIPKLPRRGHGSKQLFTSGAHLGLAYFLTWAANNADSLIIGARWGASNLGTYNRGFQLTVGPIGAFLSPLTQVAIPTLTRAEQEGRSVAQALLRIQFLVAGPVVAMMLSLALTAPSLIPLLLGPEWVAAVPVIQVLAIGECIHALSFVSYWGFLASRLSKQLLFYNLVTKPIGVALVLIGSNYGIVGVAWGYVIGLVVSWPVNLLWLNRTASFPWLDFLRNGARIVLSGMAVFVVLDLLLSGWMAATSWAAVVVGVAGFLAGYLALLCATRMGRADLARAIRIVGSIRRV